MGIAFFTVICPFDGGVDCICNVCNDSFQSNTVVVDNKIFVSRMIGSWKIRKVDDQFKGGV